jgi:hypothetical protein
VTKQTRYRTLITIVTIALVIAANTAMQLTDRYSEWLAWVVYGVTVLVVVLALRLQAHISLLQLGMLLVMPFVMIGVAALIGM